jgi:microcystin-dependent protein
VGVPDLQQKRGDKHSERGGTNTVKGTNTVTQTVTQIAVHKHSEGTNTAKLCERRAV